MLWILIGLAVIALIAWIIFWIIEVDDNQVGIAVIIAIILIFGLIIGIYCAIIDSIDWKYEEGQKVEEYELVSLREEITSVGEGTRKYVSIYAENSYTYYLEVELPASYGEGTPYESYTVSGENVFIMEDDAYINNAKLVKYVCKPKNRFWNSGIVSNKEEYVFYVPTGSIVKNISAPES